LKKRLELSHGVDRNSALVQNNGVFLQAENKGLRLIVLVLVAGHENLQLKQFLFIVIMLVILKEALPVISVDVGEHLLIHLFANREDLKIRVGLVLCLFFIRLFKGLALGTGQSQGLNRLGETLVVELPAFLQTGLMNILRNSCICLILALVATNTFFTCSGLGFLCFVSSVFTTS